MIKDLIFLHQKCEIYFYYGLFVDQCSKQEIEYDMYFINEILAYFDHKFEGMHPSIRSFDSFKSIVKQFLWFKDDKLYKLYKLA
jgi:hypothetical protein